MECFICSSSENEIAAYYNFKNKAYITSKDIKDKPSDMIAICMDCIIDFLFRPPNTYNRIKSYKEYDPFRFKCCICKFYKLRKCSYAKVLKNNKIMCNPYKRYNVLNLQLNEYDNICKKCFDILDKEEAKDVNDSDIYCINCNKEGETNQVGDPISIVRDFYIWCGYGSRYDMDKFVFNSKRPKNFLIGSYVCDDCLKSLYDDHALIHLNEYDEEVPLNENHLLEHLDEYNKEVSI